MRARSTERAQALSSRTPACSASFSMMNIARAAEGLSDASSNSGDRRTRQFFSDTANVGERAGAAALRRSAMLGDRVFMDR